ncbi:predicted protein [Naegleria gruberi]|uniref:H(+)-exporting diphosphatase n=1 Tax=Naegleria gruberi TaxID=5762 RepID=D2UYN0_NAEGR|nr:uncharacterized protein NAEGRDRAFT_61527 [Naegleria gruberi]EFC50503.1 predicted protein [Naegleria gruberi]|eukprot:XP_002683247.1 predicted protein [Naegleria gruberi strain NEG-M]
MYSPSMTIQQDEEDHCLVLAFIDFSFPDRTNTSNRFITSNNQIVIDLPVEAFMMVLSIGCICIAFMIFMWIGLKRRAINNDQQEGKEELKQLKDKLEVDAMVLTFTRQFFKREIKYLIPFIIIVGSLLIGFDQTNLFVTNSICFILGCFAVILATYVNGLISNSNSSIYSGGEIIGLSIRFGSVIGFLTLGISLIMLIACFLLFSNFNAVLSFVLGCSSISLISQLSGSVFQKSADVTMNLLGQYINSSTTGQEENLTSDHKRNPIVIAKIVGEHIGGIVAHSTDVIHSFVAIVVLSSIIGSQYFGTNGVSLPLYLVIINILTSIIGIVVAALSNIIYPSLQTNNENNQEVEKKISKLIVKSVAISGTINMVLVLALTFTLFDVITQGWAIFGCYLIGFLNGGVLIQFLFRYYTFHRYRPVQYLALNSTSWYHYVSSGFSHSVLSLIIPILSIIVNIILCSALSTFMTGGRAFGSLFGLTISGIGMSANIIFFLVLDTIVPNMNIRHLDQKETKLNPTLHTYFLTNGGVNRGCLLSITLFFCLSGLQFLMVKSGLGVVNMIDLSTLIGLIVGLVLPFIIVGLLWSTINYCSMQMINECKGQLREIDGLLEGRLNSKPNYENMNRLQGVKSIRGVIMITSIIFLAPTLIGLIGRQKMLLGFLVSFSLVGYFLSFIMLNLGFSWNSVRRIVELKYTEQSLHMDITRHNTVIADTVGISLRDSLAPSLLSSVRVVTLICLVIAPTLKFLYP